VPRGEAQRVRLRDVAALAGVSVGSASNAFGRPELVSEDVRERVLAAARELGYAGPDPSARRLRLGRAGALGLIFSERLEYQFTDPAALAFFGGLANAMQDSHLGLLLLPDSRYRDAAARTVHSAAVEGFVIYSAARNDPRVEAALARNVPVVTVDQPRDAPTPFIGIDDRTAARSAAEHLRALGHERVGVVAFVSTLDDERELTVDLSVERLEGYKDGLGPGWDESGLRRARRNAVAHGRRAALELLDAEKPPTAILAMSDILALGVLQAAAERGLDVPRDLSVVGFDDSPVAALATPALTTVAQPQDEKGRLAAEWLIEAIEQGRVTRTRRRRKILETTLVVRQSTAPPR
jgi:DNA-binding LacI/PurR family transcriptional regulator